MISYITIINIVIFRIVKYFFYAFRIILSSQRCDKTVNKVQNKYPFQSKDRKTCKWIINKLTH